VNAVDTSVVVAAFASWHEGHERPAEVLARGARLVDWAITGRATYDGLVALTAARHGARLLSRDRRAARVYEALGVDFELIV